MMINKLKVLLVPLIVIFLGACASGGMPTQEEFANMSAKSRKKVSDGLEEKVLGYALYWESVGKYLYDAQIPVRFGTKDTGTTMQWIKLPGSKYDIVSIYPNNNPPGISGNVSDGMYTAIADKKGGILYRETEGGVINMNKVLSNVTEGEDIGKTLIKSGAHVLAGLVQGVGSAAILKDAGCGNDCGDLTLISSSDGTLSAGASAVSNLTTGCTSGDCSVAPRD